MALADTGKAIGAVTQLLHDHLENHQGVTVDDVKVGRPEEPTGAAMNSILNLFLYEIQFDASLKNVSLDEGQPSPLWLVLKYLITAFDNQGESDSIEAHEYLGEGIRALQELSFLPLTAASLKALNDNPEVLKLTFDETPSDLLSKLTQGPDEKYRCSVGFEVRPVLIAPSQPPSYSLLVGVDYTASPPDLVGDEGIKIPVIPSMGPLISEVSPLKFEVNSTIKIFGNDLNLPGLSVLLGSAELAVTAQKPNELQCVVNGTISGGGSISAGSHPICVVQTLPTGRKRTINLLVANLLPRLDSATFALDPAPDVFGSAQLTGSLLGRASDDIFIALYRDGKVIKMFDQVTTTPTQQLLTLTINESDAVPNGEYQVILRVNGQQAKNSPAIMV
ncbi:MAG: DUF4255 domain-containing protein [Thermodesulfobacteriota bacterium]